MTSVETAPASGARKLIDVDGRLIGSGEPCYVIAELSANHNHRLQTALDVISMAADAGADAVKIQTYTPDTLTIDCDEPPFVISGGTPWEGRKLYELYADAMTPWEWHEPMKAHADSLGIQLFSTPFDTTAVEFLMELGVPAMKIASFEMVDHALIEAVAATGKPILMSTGMATMEEIGEAVAVARCGGADDLILLRCNSAYPAPLEQMDLRSIPDMAERFDVATGLSDHTLGVTAAVSAVALGACVIEKHVTMSREDPGPDSAFSLEPRELREMIQQVRDVERALGGVRYGPTDQEKASIAFRRSLFVVDDIEPGELLTTDNVRSIRPGYGLAPKHLDEVLGRTAAIGIRRGTPLQFDLLA